MKRVLGGFAAALTLTICLAAPAQSAEIPPTPECETAYAELLELNYQLPRDLSPERGQKALRKFAESLEAAGCISDAVPLYRNIPAKPFTEQCYEAAAEAEAFIGPLTTRARPWGERFERKVYRPYFKRSQALFRKLMDPKVDDARQLRKLSRKLNNLTRSYTARSIDFLTKIERIWAKDARGIALTYFELRSLLCTSNDLPLFGPRPGPDAGPGVRFLSRNIDVVFLALLYPIREWLKWLRKAAEPGRPTTLEATASPGLPRARLGTLDIAPFHSRD
jgi:hypothetical protein